MTTQREPDTSAEGPRTSGIWYAIHRYDGVTCSVSCAFATRDAALAARSGNGTFVGVISSDWLRALADAAGQAAPEGGDDYYLSIARAAGTTRAVVKKVLHAANYTPVPAAPVPPPVEGLETTHEERARLDKLIESGGELSPAVGARLLRDCWRLEADAQVSRDFMAVSDKRAEGLAKEVERLKAQVAHADRAFVEIEAAATDDEARIHELEAKLAVYEAPIGDGYETTADWRREVRGLAKKATPGPWGTEAVKSDHGRDSFDAYEVRAISEHSWLNGQSIVDTFNSGMIEVQRDEERSWDEVGRCNVEYIAAVHPTAILSLLNDFDRLSAAHAECKGENTKLREALKPFADEADRYDPDDGDGEQHLRLADGVLRIKHLRAARAALAPASEEKAT